MGFLEVARVEIVTFAKPVKEKAGRKQEKAVR
jgi:hypothetical protein